MTILTNTSTDQSPKQELFELRRGYLPTLIGAAAFILWLWTVLWLFPYQAIFQEMWLSLGTLLLTCLVTWIVFRWNSPWSSHVFILGLILTVTTVAGLFDLTTVPYAFAPILVAAAFATGPGFMFICAGSVTTLLTLLALRASTSLWPFPLLPQLVVLWTVALAAWLSSRYLYLALEWTLASQAEAQQARREAEAHRAELARLIQTQDILSHQLEQANHRLAWAQQMAEEARHLKFQFATNLSHELRTPLNLVIGFSELMQKSPEVYGEFAWPSSLRGDIYEIYSNAKHLLDLINDVLDLAQVDAGYVALRREKTDLPLLLGEGVAIAKGLLRGRPIQLKLDIPDTLPTLSVDRTRIQQVLLNLISNAARFTTKGCITVGAIATDSEVIVSVSDTGIGIAPEELERIFEEFHRVDDSAAHGTRGTGLGLAICRAFIHLHRGRTWAESKVGEGSKFSFALPRPGVISTSNLRQSQDPSLYPADFERRVAVIDPAGSLHSLLDRYMSTWKTTSAPDPQTAAALAAANQVDAIVMQVGTLDLAQALPSLSRQKDLEGKPVPLVLCAMPGRNELASSLHVAAFLNKPITRQQLLAAVEQIPTPVKRILMVDDDPSFLRLLTRILRSTGRAYTLERAYTGTEALINMRRRRPDLVILDMLMPEMDGAEVAEQMHQDPALIDIPILLITAKSVREQEMPIPVTLVITRPTGLTASELVRGAQSVLTALLSQKEHGESNPAVPAGAPPG